MSDRLSRSNSQSQLPNYGQDKSEEKNTNVGTGNKDASAKSDKNASRGSGENKQAKPQLKSKELKKVGDSSQSSSDPVIDLNSPFGKLFLNQQPGRVRKEADQSEDSSSEDQLPKSPRQQQSNTKEKTANKKVPKLSLENLGNVLKGLASDRREMTVSPRKTRRGTQDSQPDAGTPTTTAKRTTTTTSTSTTTTATTTTTTKNAVLVPSTFGVTTTSWTPASPRPKNSSAVQSATVTTTNQTGPDAKTAAVKTEKTAEVKEKAAGTVDVGDLSERSIKTINSALSGAIVSGADLAELLVCVQSRGYKNPLAGSNTDSILRGSMTVKDFPDPNSKEKKTIDVNIIEKVSGPFIKKYWDTPEIAELRIAAMQKFNEGNLKIPDGVKKMNARDLRKNKTYINAMRPLVNLVSEKIIGKTMDLSTAPIHDQVKELLKGIDAYVIEWSKKDQGIKPEELFLARKSAIAAFVANRSFIYIWFTVFADKDKPELREYVQMTSYLTTMLTVVSDKFYFSVMSNASGQDTNQKKLLEDNKNSTAFSSLGKPKKLTDKQFATAEQRKEKRAIKKEVENFLINFDESLIDSNFSDYLQTIVASSKENYSAFRKNPAQFSLDTLNDYWFSFDSTDGSDLFIESTILGKLKQLLEIKIESERADDSGKTTTSTVATNTTTTTNTNPTQASSEEDGSPRKQ